jgi:arylsulfatase A-like enzyme
MGATELGYRGDNIVQLDWCVGEVMRMLEEYGIEENTILIFTSDNGPVYIDGGYQDGSDKGNHKAAGIYRGGKYQIYEGGNRVPFIIRWPAKIKSGVSDALVSQVDLLASFAELLDAEIPPDSAPDSRNYWDTFIGKEALGAELILEQANTKENGIALRKGKLKYINIRDEQFGIYDLETDPSEKNNLIPDNPELVDELKNDLDIILEKGLRNYTRNLKK